MSLFRKGWGFLVRLTSMRGIVWLTVIALLLAFTTFFVLAGGVQVTHLPQLQAILFLFDFITLLLIGAAAIKQLGHMLAERRMGVAGARLHTRLVTLFGIVAVAPTLMLGALATLFFHFGVEIWFSNRVNTALTEAQSVAAGYLREHNDNTRTEAFALANTLLTVQNDEFLTRGSDIFHDPSRLQSFLEDEVTERGLTDAVIFDSLTRKIIATGGLLVQKDKHSFITTLPPKSMIEMARAGDVAVLDEPDSRVIRAVISLGTNSGLMLVLTKQVDPDILRHVRKTTTLVHDYQRMIQNRGKTQIAFVGIFALMGLLVLAVGMMTGLSLANRIARPLSLLILAARRVSQGDLAVRVPVRNKSDERDDEVGTLSRAFNGMTDQLESQRKELLSAYDQINERRRFTETVLGGVSAGVIGLDKRQIIELPNRMASTILQCNLQERIGTFLVDAVPEFATLLESACKMPGHEHMAEIQIDVTNAPAPGGPGSGGGVAAGRTLLVKIVAEWRGEQVEGYVVTFDDITQLQIAQRKGAWADVARRVAHEIKNPLTPIQLAAERLKKRFQKEITSAPETYNQLIETIIRQVGDIGRMVDEFSAFARMPEPVMELYDLARLCREALILQRHAHPEIIYETYGLEQGPVMALCDRRLLGQALTNLLQNAADALAMTNHEVQNGSIIGHIAVKLVVNSYEAVISVEDDGVGLPERERHRLVEPYVTYKPKGTGLGLAIVKKIMDAHGGRLSLEDRKAPPKAAGENGAEEDIRGTCVSLSVLLPGTEKMIADLSDYEGKA